MWHGDQVPDDQVPAGRRPRGAAAGPGGPAALLGGAQPQGLHPAPALRRFGAEGLLQDRLPRRRATAGRLQRAARRAGTGPGPALLHPLLRRRPAAKKGEVVCLLFRATTSAAERGLIGGRPTAAVDATGLESRHTSRYFFKRAGRRHSARLWTKLTVACDTASHFLAAAAVSAGPSTASPQSRRAMAQASWAVGWARVLADAAFDSEAHPRYCRERLGVRSTVIALNRRGRGRKWPKTKYRRQMVRRFRRRPRG